MGTQSIGRNDTAKTDTPLFAQSRDVFDLHKRSICQLRMYYEMNMCGSRATETTAILMTFEKCRF